MSGPRFLRCASRHDRATASNGQRRMPKRRSRARAAARPSRCSSPAPASAVSPPRSHWRDAASPRTCSSGARAFSEEGAGIQIGPNGTRILRELNVAEALQPHVGIPHPISVREGESGMSWRALPLGRWIEARHGAPYWVAQRSDLHAALLHVRAQRAADRTVDGICRRRGGDRARHGWRSRTARARPGRAARSSAPTVCGRRCGSSRSSARSRALLARAPHAACVPLDMLPPEFQAARPASGCFPTRTWCTIPVSATTELAIVAILPDGQEETGLERAGAARLGA